MSGFDWARLRDRLIDRLIGPTHTGADEQYAEQLHDWATEAAEDTGRHHISTVTPVTPDWSPLPPADRQHIAPTHYADKAIPASPADTTGWLDPREVLAQ